jgi:hypothetical protein
LEYHDFMGHGIQNNNLFQINFDKRRDLNIFEGAYFLVLRKLMF